MARCPKLIQSLCLACSLATGVSCGDPAGPLFPTLDLTLASQLGAKRDFYEGEPIYVAFSLSNHGSDTVWTRPYSFSAWFLDGEVTDSVGTALDKWGLIADYIFHPGYRGVPLAPGNRIYQLPLVQDRWGLYSPQMVNTYGGHTLPPGQYTLQVRFYSDIPGRSISRAVFADPVTFRVHPRSSAEEQSFQRLQVLMALFFTRDTTQRAAFADSLMANVQSRPWDDPIVPLLTARLWWAAVGYPQDSSKLDAFVNISIAAARAQRGTAAGAYAVLAVQEMRPAAVGALAQELTGSLAGDVAASLATH